MITRRRQFAALLLASLLLGSVGASAASAQGKGNSGRDLLRAAIATAGFHSTHQASRTGYGPFPDGVPLHECISSFDGTGAMGVHWLNPAYLTTDLSPSKPQVLVYEPDAHGRLKLVALEFVVFKADWDAAHPGTMPELFGEMFMSTPEPNRFEIPAFYSLHVWLWKANPSGLFAPFNPRVSCDPRTAGVAAPSVAALAAADASARTAAARPAFNCAIRRPTSA